MERLTNRDKDKYEVTTMSKSGIPGEVLTFEYTHKCEPCKPTQPECGECEFAKPITNADRIRAMTDEELADWVWGVETAGRAYGPRCKNAWLDWLKQEVSF